MSSPTEVLPSAERVDVAIVGGGLCGILAAARCAEAGFSYQLIERNGVLGGNWQTMANGHSKLQAYEPMYRWDPKFRLNKNIFSQNSAGRVRLGKEEAGRREDAERRAQRVACGRAPQGKRIGQCVPRLRDPRLLFVRTFETIR